MPEWAFLLTIIAFAIVMLPTIVAAVVVSIISARSRSAAFQRASEGEHAAAIQSAKRHDDWAAARGFVPVGHYTLNLFMPSFIAAWQHEESPTFFCLYWIDDNGGGKYAYDFLSNFSKDVGLTTASSKGGHMFPRSPGSCVQTFSELNLDQLWDRHAEAERYLVDNCNVEMQNLDGPFESVFIEHLRSQMQYVSSVKFWRLRAIYWFLTRSRRSHNLSIKQQHERGLLDIPTCRLPHPSVPRKAGESRTGSRDS